MSWLGRLQLHYSRDGHGRTIALDRHEGPLRVLQRLYPEGPGICHHVLVHPPGGVAAGDVLEIQASFEPGAHAVLTTPGATRFYRSEGETAVQRVQLTLAEGARCEWLPLENIAYDGCLAENHLQLDLAPGAQAMGWDVLALGLPAAGRPFAHGRFVQHSAWPGLWLERGVIDAEDALLLDSPLGLAGHRVLGMAWLATGSAWTDRERDGALEAAREACSSSPLMLNCGVTSPQPQLLVLRVLAHRVEPVMALLKEVRAAWRQVVWHQAGGPLRLWAT
ncbi:MAG: urease accessory protein UreD [Rubrivivax sp.]|nr:urease accessory protein UreD [Rubrivivax sp.]